MPLLVTTGKGSTDTHNVTTDPIDTTGATLIVVALGCFPNVSATLPVFSDNKGNVWNELASGYPGIAREFLYFCTYPNVGAGHTFSALGGDIPSLHVSAWSGFTAYDGVYAAHGVPNGYGISTPSITPNGANRLIIAAVCFGGGTGDLTSVNAPLTVLTPEIGTVHLTHMASIAAYEVQTTATARLATFTYPLYTGAAALIAAFADIPGIETLPASAVYSRGGTIHGRIRPEAL